MLLLISSIKLIAEIALLALIGRGLLGLLAGSRREANFCYRLLTLLAQPFLRTMRLIAPRVVLDRHIPAATFIALAMVWVVSTLAKIDLCLRIGVELCR
ncbi:MAG: hypothetical protein KGL18_07845 [Burkholderiales bacterium]|nr:hypothetical protein [Burkholderiales bacterium]MDE1926651.1 hypothetical protein [Burkholderiales bacterium]MDE2159544.1 hypothetical protein [Burkholderiales bacterium]MDE2502872.1 hypothetical protein [Burkholderiales bacterium]